MVPPQTIKFTMRGQFSCWQLTREVTNRLSCGNCAAWTQEPKIEGRRGDRSQGCPGPQGRIVVEDQARSVSQAGVTLASNACEFSMTSAASDEAWAPAFPSEASPANSELLCSSE